MQVSAVPDGSFTNLYKHSSGEKNQCLLFHYLRNEYQMKSWSNKYKNDTQQFMSMVPYCKIFTSCLLRRSGFQAGQIQATAHCHAVWTGQWEGIIMPLLWFILMSAGELVMQPAGESPLPLASSLSKSRQHYD